MVGRVPFAQQQGLHVVKQRGGLQPWLTGTLNLDSRELHPRWVFFQEAPPEFCQTFWGWFGSSRILPEAIFSVSAFQGEAAAGPCESGTPSAHAIPTATVNAMLGRSFRVVPVLSTFRCWT